MLSPLKALKCSEICNTIGLNQNTSILLHNRDSHIYPLEQYDTKLYLSCMNAELHIKGMNLQPRLLCKGKTFRSIRISD